MKKRVISAFLCTVMAVSLLTGCGSDEKKSADNKGSKDGNYEEFITVDVYDEFANYQGVQSGWFAKIVKDKFNMELNIIAPNVAGGGQTLYQTRSAAGELGDLVFVNLPEEGDSVSVGEAFGDVESVKAVSDVYSPVSGVVCEINEELLDAPESINGAPYDAWFIKVKEVSEKEELLSPSEYEAFVASEQ